MTLPIVSRTLRAIEPTGEEFELILSIGTPYQAQPMDWACLVHITRMFEPSRPLIGVDAWQAVQLAYQFMASQLNGFLARGGRLFWQGTERAIALEDLFPHVPVFIKDSPAA
jgi:hypothetical protein